MSDWKKAKWKKGKEVISGSWIYHWAADCVTIWRDENDPLTGQPIKFRVYGEHPEFAGFKLVREKVKKK